jgi:cytochrome c oxidase cbb3-type subunit 3
MAPGLNNIGFLAAASDQIIKTTLMQGREGTPMQSFLKFGLSEQDIDDVVSYVRSFEQQAAMRQALPPKDVRPVLSFQSSRDFAKTVQKLKEIMVDRNFRVIREGPLESGLVERGQENQRQWVIYFGNLEFIDKPLKTDPRLGLFLPGRVTVVERGGVVRVMAANPLAINALFNNDGLAAIIEELHQTYLNILMEATT